MRKLIGLSVSMCIKDIIAGKVDISEVVCIIGATKIKGEFSLSHVIEVYADSYWREDPIEGERILRDLWARDLIVQPKLGGRDHPGQRGGHWIAIGEDEESNQVVSYIR